MNVSRPGVDKTLFVDQTAEELPGVTWPIPAGPNLRTLRSGAPIPAVKPEPHGRPRTTARYAQTGGVLPSTVLRCYSQVVYYLVVLHSALNVGVNRNRATDLVRPPTVPTPLPTIPGDFRPGDSPVRADFPVAFRFYDSNTDHCSIIDVVMADFWCSGTYPSDAPTHHPGPSFTGDSDTRLAGDFDVRTQARCPDPVRSVPVQVGDPLRASRWSQEFDRTGAFPAGASGRSFGKFHIFERRSGGSRGGTYVLIPARISGDDSSIQLFVTTVVTPVIPTGERCPTTICSHPQFPDIRFTITDPLTG